MKSKTLLPEKWAKEADVVVVGYGAAGAATAITAHDAGARVLILEKAPKGEEGGNSRVAGQGWCTVAPVNTAITYFNALCGAYTVEQGIVRAWAEEMGRNTDWVKSLGGNAVEIGKGPEGAEFPDLPGAECVRMYTIDGSLGYERLWKVLKASVDKRRIEVLYATQGKELIQDSQTKEIIGVRTEGKGAPFSLKARRAVVLTCGGFESNQEMIRDFLPNLVCCYPVGTPYNTGDGIKMAMAVGADLWHMNNISGPWYYLKVPEFPSVMELVPQHQRKEIPGGMIIVAADGKRFKSEKHDVTYGKHNVTHGKIKVAGQWIQAPAPYPMFMIIDHTLFSAGPLHDNNLYHGWNSLLKVYNWSEDNSAELAKGWIKKAATIAGLARKIGLNPTAVEDTINKWNAYCSAGNDAEFGRTKMLSPIKDGPFYAIEISPAFSSTQGGPRRNARSQIVRPDGSSIPRLYSAGELGSIHSYLYQGGGNLGECMAFGRISGRNAAAEKPRV
ncbi:MAG: FAD-dependent oxidoreductase [Betaproteobacteria bacterium]|nr:FAD-dependent oxidoreductase [Betaproteobacteria bacterium]